MPNSSLDKIMKFEKSCIKIHSIFESTKIISLEKLSDIE
jgi:hypothetical protein